MQRTISMQFSDNLSGDRKSWRDMNDACLTLCRDQKWCSHHSKSTALIYKPKHVSVERYIYFWDFNGARSLLWNVWWFIMKAQRLKNISKTFSSHWRVCSNWRYFLLAVLNTAKYRDVFWSALKLQFRHEKKSQKFAC